MIPLRPECPLLARYNPVMLPATFQTPAALVLLCGGLLACFAGYRVFRVVLAIYGFILGVLLASSFMGTEQTLWMILIWLGAGLAGALILHGRVFRRGRAARRADRRARRRRDLGVVRIRTGDSHA